MDGDLVGRWMDVGVGYVGLIKEKGTLEICSRPGLVIEALILMTYLGTWKEDALSRSITCLQSSAKSHRRWNVNGCLPIEGFFGPLVVILLAPCKPNVHDVDITSGKKQLHKGEASWHDLGVEGMVPSAEVLLLGLWSGGPGPQVGVSRSSSGAPGRDPPAIQCR